MLALDAPVNAWERVVLPARIDRYESSLLDTLCLSGEVGWAQRGGVVLFLREHAGAWLGIPPATRRISERTVEAVEHGETREVSDAAG